MFETRRRYLQRLCGLGSLALATGLAGCAGGPPRADGGSDDSDGPGGANDSDGDAGETRPSGTGGPGVTLASVDDAPDLPVQPGVEVVREAATEEHPPRLRTTLTNTADSPVQVGEGRAVHFEYVTADSGILVLLPGNTEQEYPAEPDCWRLTEGIATTEEYRTFEIEPDGESSRPVDLYATPDADGCLPVGEHRFETTISVVSDDAEPEASTTWGFSVLLE